MGWRKKLLLVTCASYQNEYGADVLPADPPKQARAVTDHFFDVPSKIVRAVYPADARRFYEYNEKDGQPGTVDVQHVY